MTRRVESVQLLRGLAAALVLLAHALDVAAGRALGLGETRSLTAGAFSVLGASGVDLFFVISGFVMAFSIERFQGGAGASRFLVHRAIRIVPLYWLLSILFAAYLALSGAVPETRSMIEMATILPIFDGPVFHFPPLGVGWTLSFEAAFYILVAVAIAGRGDRARRLLWLTSAAGVAGIFIVPTWAAARILINPMMLEFAMGVGAFLAWRGGLLQRGGAVLLVGGLVVVAVPYRLFDVGSIPIAAGAVLSSEFSLARAATRGLVWTLVLAIAIRKGQLSSDLPVRVGQAVGDASYSIYLVHIPVMALSAALLATLNMPVWSFAPVLFAASVAGGLLVYRFVEVPLLAWCRSLAIAAAPASKALAT